MHSISVRPASASWSRACALVLLACAASLVLHTPARADVDVTNRWFVHITEFAPGGWVGHDYCTIDLVQSGTEVASPTYGFCGGSALLLSGAIDPQSGSFVWSGTYVTAIEREFTLTGTVGATGGSFLGGATGPQFVAHFEFGLCGNGSVDPGEQCDGSASGADCCTASCLPVADGTACDGGPCASASTCSAGACVGTPKPAGTACDLDATACTADACDGAGACAAGACSPCCGGPGCTIPDSSGSCLLGHRARVHVKSTIGGKGDRLSFAMPRSWSFDADDIGDPLTTTDLDVCLFRIERTPPFGGEPALIAGVHVPAGGSCNGKPCWRRRSNGTVDYRNPRLEGNGIASLQIRPGSFGKARIGLTGRGPNLELPATLGPLPNGELLVRVQSSESCWSALFDLDSEPGAIHTATELRGKRGEAGF